MSEQNTEIGRVPDTPALIVRNDPLPEPPHAAPFFMQPLIRPGGDEFWLPNGIGVDLLIPDPSGEKKWVAATRQLPNGVPTSILFITASRLCGDTHEYYLPAQYVGKCPFNRAMEIAEDKFWKYVVAILPDRVDPNFAHETLPH